MMTYNDSKGWNFYPILTQIIDSSSCLPFNSAFYIVLKRFQEIPEHAEMLHNMMTSLYDNNDNNNNGMGYVK